MRGDAPVILTRLTAAVGLSIGLAMAIAAPAIAAEPQPGEGATTCTNLYSGSNWQIRIDYGKATVDSNPARISDAQISWRDASDGGNYTLDRKSGKLTVILASSTGGSFFYHQCKLEH
jgi:hypothetical protein